MPLQDALSQLTAVALKLGPLRQYEDSLENSHHQQKGRNTSALFGHDISGNG
jgi:hypothetical protein